MKFTVTQKELMEASGYSRQQLQNDRYGYTLKRTTKKRGEVVYTIPPRFKVDRDYRVFGTRGILYAKGLLDSLRKPEPPPTTPCRG